MQSKWSASGWLVLVTLLTGCTGSGIKPQDQTQLVRGTLSREAEGYRFVPCGARVAQPVEVGSETLQREQARHSLGEGWPVYVEALAAPQAGQLSLLQPLVVGGSLAACDHTLAEIELRGVTDDGQRVIDLRERQIRVQYRGRLLQLGFERPPVQRLARERHWQQTMTAPGGRGEHELALTVVPTPCRGGSGAWYALSMSAEVNGEAVQGCARLGDLQHWPLRERYRTPDSIRTRRIELLLTRDGRFRLREDYLNQQPVIELQGRWRRPAVDRLQLVPDEAELAPLRFRLSPQGDLQLVHFHPAYGDALRLEPDGALLRLRSGELDWWD